MNPSHDLWNLLSQQWTRHLAARNAAPRTISGYEESMTRFAQWAAAEGHPSPVDMSVGDVEAYFSHLFEATNRHGKPYSAASVARDYRQIKVFFAWLAEVEDIPNVMLKVKAPHVPEKPVPVFTPEDLRRLLDACKGKGFPERRDTAIMRLLFDTGVRRTELAEVSVDDVAFEDQLLRVFGKGRRERIVPYGAKSAEALDTYMRARMRHPDRHLDALWLGSYPHHRGPLGSDGIRQMLKRRARDAGVQGSVFAHRFRHTAAHMRLDAGLSEGDAMRLFGWKTRAMLDRYGAAAAHARAIRAAKRNSPADEI